MPILIIDNGTNNTIGISAELIDKGNGRIQLDGNDNRIVVDPSALAFDGYFHLNGGASIRIGEKFNGTQVFIYAVKDTQCCIGDQVGFNGAVRLLMHEPGILMIGNGCLLASDVDVTISDMHSIIDIETQERINPARNITIGNRVWIGQRCMILKGARIGDGSVIGAGSIVSKVIPANCLAAGNPVHLLRPNITWDQRLL